MILSEIKAKIEKLNCMIMSNKKNGSVGKDIEMLLLSARATMYLRNKELEKLEKVANEIDEVFKSNQKDN